ncbi:hypothetical protein ACA910_001396 [Epithemia clementina (nom. ined.)]
MSNLDTPISTLLTNQTIQVVMVDDKRNNKNHIFLQGHAPESALAQVVQADIATSNGVVFMIDHVLFPSFPLGPTLMLQPQQTAPHSFTYLYQALQVTNLWDVINTRSANYTMFAPTDGAFESLGNAAWTYLLEHVDVLESIALYHVIQGWVLTEQDLINEDSPLAAGSLATMHPQGQTLEIILEPPDADQANHPIQILVKGNGNQQQAQDLAMVTQRNIPALNGVIHVLNQVVLPRLPLGVTLALDDQNNYSTFLTALRATSNLGQLANNQFTQWTMFVPTNQAFAAALGSGIWEYFLANNPDIVEQIVLYHIVNGLVPLTDLSTMDTLQTLNKQYIGIHQNDDGGADSLSIQGNANDSKENDCLTPQVTLPYDWVAQNGYIHTLDRVLLPFLPVGATAVLRVGLDSLFVQALQAANILERLNDFQAIFTVLAPTNAALEAFVEASAISFQELLNDPQLLTPILLTQVFQGGALYRGALENVIAANGGAPVDLESLSGTALRVSMSNPPTGESVIAVNSMGAYGSDNSDSNRMVQSSATIVQTDVIALRGVIHWIDAVLVPFL